MSDLFLSIAIAGVALLCVSVVVFSLMFCPNEIKLGKWCWKRKPNPEKPKSKWLDLVWRVQERQLEAEMLDRERDELIKLYGG